MATQLFDAGDTVPCEVSVIHQFSTRQTSAFRYTHNYKYPSELFYFNDSDPASAIFRYASVPIADFTTVASFLDNMGIVPFNLNEKGVLDTIEPIIYLKLTDEVRHLSPKIVSYEVRWNSLPFGYDGGREYNYSNSCTYNTRGLQLQLAALTSDILTPGLNLQVQEKVFANATVTFPEV